VSRKANPALIGSFVLGGVLLAVIAVVAFGSGQLFRDTQRYISFFEGSVAGLNVGAQVRFRGIAVGSVREILLDIPGVARESDDLRIAVIYDLDRAWVEQRGASARLADPLDINTLIELGIRAQLGTESLVTGIKYVSLDLNPANPIVSVPVPGAPYPEIPTVNTGLERIEDAAYGIISDLGAVPLDSLVTVATHSFARFAALADSPDLHSALERLPRTIDRLDGAIVDLQGLLARVDSAVGPMGESVRLTAAQVRATMRSLDATLADVGTVLDGADGLLEADSPVFVQFERAMLELGGASRALRDLADYLERNPSALLRGRPGGGR
jgi:paraquat-inducible protein B